jgi:hypothetical protein
MGKLKVHIIITGCMRRALGELLNPKLAGRGSWPIILPHVHIPHFTYSSILKKNTSGSQLSEKKEIVFHFSVASAAHNHCCSNVKSHFSLFSVHILSLCAARWEKAYAERPAICICIHKRPSETMAYFIPEHAVRSPFLYANLHTVLFFYYSLSCTPPPAAAVECYPIAERDKISSLRAAAMKKKNTVSIHACIE